MDGDLVGREHEHALLAECAAAAAGGRGALVLLAGEAGVGKTALARTALRGSGLEVLAGAGSSSGTPPYGPLVEGLRDHLRSGDPAVRAALAGGPLAGHLARLLPELGPAAPVADAATIAESLRQALEAVTRRRPAALLLDDLQWADDATLDLLPALAQWAAAAPLLVVGAYRSDDLRRGHPIRRVRAELRRAGRLRQVALEPLDAEGTAALLGATVGPVGPGLLRAVLERTDGLPFFVAELGAALAASGRLRPAPAGLELTGGDHVPLPESVRDAVLLRAADLPDAARAAVLVAAVAGHDVDPELVTAVAELAEWPDELVRRGIVVDLPAGRMAFRHALVREAFYAEIPWTRRLALHRAVAERLEAAGAPAAVVAEHWAIGRRPEQARGAWLAAADASAGVHAYRDAARALRRALELWPEDGDGAGRLAALERLGSCCELAGAFGEAAAVWRELTDAHERLGAVHASALAGRRLGTALELQGRWQEALAGRERAAAAFTAAGLPAEAAGERLAAAAHLRSAASFRAALSLLELAAPQARAAGRVDLEARVLGLEGNVRARMGEGAAAVELVRSGLALALEHGATGAAAEVYQRLADALEHGGDYPGARRTYDDAYAFCAANGLEPTGQLCLACLTAVLRQSGEWDRAGELCREILASPAGGPHARAVAAGMLGSILALRGRTSKARPLLLESLTLARRIELVAMEMLALWGLALADTADGAPASAAGHARALIDRWRGTEDRHYVVSPLRWAATFFAGTADPDAVRACAAALAELAAGVGDDEAMSALSHALGEVALVDGDAAQATEHFARALALLHGVEAPFDRALSGRRAAAALAAAGRRDTAVEQLVAAHRTARRLGAVPLATLIGAELEALGERPGARLDARAPAAVPAGGLTRREVEVVRLVAAGRTNREIASELFLSPRTVEMHVSNVITKLDCRSRVDAARRADELGLLSAPL